MFKYVQLDNENIVVGISYLEDEITADNMILINELEAELGSTYNRETGEFTPPEPQPTPEPTPTLEDVTKATLLETQYQTIMLEILSGF